MIVVAGPRAIGKTYWIDTMLKEHAGSLQRVKTTTTRQKREEADLHSYNFVTEAGFQERLDAGRFLEHDTYRGFRYASSLAAIIEVLEKSHGIMALTPVGVAAVWDLRDRLNVRVVRLVPSDDNMVVRNLDRRGIVDEHDRRALVEHAKAFDLYPHIEAQVVIVTGDTAIDGPAVRAALTPQEHPVQ